jgi:hypothetical protein
LLEALDCDLLLDALDLLPPLLLAAVPERGLLFEALLLFAPLLLFAGLERLAEPLEPLELCELFFCLLDEPLFDELLFVCAITPPWVSTALG